MPRYSFRDRFLTPPVARAIMSPLGIVMFGVGAAGSILLGAPLAVAAGVGALAWGGRVVAAVPRNPGTDRIEPFALSEPWRSYVVGAQASKTRFDGVVDDMDRGPLRERLAQLANRLDDGIDESWRIAKRGNDISDALARLDTVRTEKELAQLRLSLTDRPPSAAAAKTIQSLEAQIGSARRLQATQDDARDRLRLLDARFDELVARAVEVSLGTADSDVLGNDVDGLVGELEALRAALEETNSLGHGTFAERSTDSGSPFEPPAAGSSSAS
jgi:hypothetical protein